MKTLHFSCLILLFTSFCFSTNDTSVTSGSDFSTSGDLTTGYIDTNTTGNSTEKCLTYQDCNSCISDVNCIFCQSTNTCASGHWFGPSSTCSDWRWKQCMIKGTYALLAAGGVLLLILIIFGVSICCCCCCCRKKHSKKQLKDFKEFKAIQMEEEKENLISKHPKTDARRAELEKKYSSKLSSTNV